MKIDKDTKIEIAVGCVDFLVLEIETLRNQKAILNSQVDVMNNFFNLVDRIGDKPRSGYGEDHLYQAKREIEEAKLKAAK